MDSFDIFNEVYKSIPRILFNQRGYRNLADIEAAVNADFDSEPGDIPNLAPGEQAVTPVVTGQLAILTGTEFGNIAVVLEQGTLRDRFYLYAPVELTETGLLPLYDGYNMRTSDLVQIIGERRRNGHTNIGAKIELVRQAFVRKGYSE